MVYLHGVCEKEMTPTDDRQRARCWHGVFKIYFFMYLASRLSQAHSRAGSSQPLLTRIAARQWASAPQRRAAGVAARPRRSMPRAPPRARDNLAGVRRLPTAWTRMRSPRRARPACSNHELSRQRYPRRARSKLSLFRCRPRCILRGLTPRATSTSGGAEAHAQAKAAKGEEAGAGRGEC